MNDKPLYPEPRVIRRLTQWTPDPSAPGERANMNWQLKGHNLEIIVWPRAASEKGKPPIRANMHTLQANILIEHIRLVAAEQGKTFRDLPLRNKRKANKDDPDSQKEIYDQAIVRVVKTTEGVVQIGVFDVDESRPRILFPFILDQWTGFLKYNGEPLTIGEVSSMVATRTAQILEDLLNSNVEVTTESENKQMYQPTTKTKPPFRKTEMPNGSHTFADIDM